MNVDEKDNNPVKEEAPEWAKNLQETMQSIADSLLHPQQEETDPNEPTPIPVPEPPQPKEEPTPEPILDPQPQDEPKPKKKSLWEWLR